MKDGTRDGVTDLKNAQEKNKNDIVEMLKKEVDELKEEMSNMKENQREMLEILKGNHVLSRFIPGQYLFLLSSKFGMLESMFCS